MFKPVKFLVLALCLLIMLAIVSAQNSTEIADSNESSELVDEARKRHRKPFGHIGGWGHHGHYGLWCK